MYAEVLTNQDVISHYIIMYTSVVDRGVGWGRGGGQMGQLALNSTQGICVVIWYFHFLQGGVGGGGCLDQQGRLASG